MAEQTGAGGIILISKETTKGTAVRPALACPWYQEAMDTNINLISDEPAYGNKFKRQQNLPGVRGHQGTLQVQAEPNTGASWFDMLMTKGTTTGSNPYTHPYTTSVTDPNSYTVDIQYSDYVKRFIGVEASKIALGEKDDEWVFDLELSARKSFYTRQVASIAAQVITLKSDGQYESPTDGLVAGDTLRIWDVSAQAYINCTVSSVDNATDITVTGTISAAAAGDIVGLRPQTPSLALLTPFLFPKTKFFFAADAATALSNSSTSSNQTRLEPGTTLEIMHDFNDNEGSKRSGDFDPASLPRIQYDAVFNVKVPLEDPESHDDWTELVKKACVMRAYSGANNQYEMRVTFNNLKAKTNETPSEPSSVIFHEVEYSPQNDTSDGQALDVKFINARSSI